MSRAASTRAMRSVTVASGWRESSSTKIPSSSSITPRSSTRRSESRSRSLESWAVLATPAGSRPARLATIAITGSTLASMLSRPTFDAAAGIGAEPGLSSSASRARMSGLRTFRVCVRGRSGSGHIVEPRICWWARGAGWRSERHRPSPTGRRAAARRGRGGRLQRPANHRRITDAGIVVEHSLDVLGVDLLAVGQGEHVLLPTAECQHAVLREGSEIARVVPAVGVDRAAVASAFCQ